jgi:hypothetical protein
MMELKAQTSVGFNDDSFYFMAGRFRQDFKTAPGAFGDFFHFVFLKFCSTTNTKQI